MREVRRMTMVLAMSLLCAAAAPTALAAPAFVNGLALDGGRLDRSGGTDANTGRVGYFSDIYDDPARGHWWGLSDRGPGGGALHYETRVQRFRLKIDRATGAISGFKILKTVMFTDEVGNPLDGIAPTPPNELGHAFVKASPRMRLDPKRSAVRNASGPLQRFPTERTMPAMTPSRRRMKAPSVLLFVISAVCLANSATANELIGFALMPANTFAEGPTSGQFAGPGAGGNALPLINQQPVQGISAVLHGPNARSFYIMPDNGFGAQTNSADALLRVYAVRPHFKAWNGSRVTGRGTVSPADFRFGHALAQWSERSFITLRDPDRQLGFDLVADLTNYPNGSHDIPVDPAIQAGRLLTGADFDIEAVRMDRNGHFWFGEEFGPFLVETDARGKVLRAEVGTPNIVPPGSTATGVDVRSPQHPYLGAEAPNLDASRGFEGMAINPAGDTLYTLLEGTVTGDNAIDGTVHQNLRINQFDLTAATWTGRNWLYQLEPSGTNIGDMTAINDHQFLVIERNGATATGGGTPFKKIYRADSTGVANGGFVQKTELVDLMHLSDPHDLNGDGSVIFTFPFVTIESVLMLDPWTLLVINDNNYPGTGGRDLHSDHTEFIKIRLDQPLAWQPFDRDDEEDDDQDDDRGRQR